MKRKKPVTKEKAKPVTKEKAKEILRHGEVRDTPLTEKQKGLFGLIAGGGTPTRMEKKSTRSSPAYTDRELEQGYRCLG